MRYTSGFGYYSFDLRGQPLNLDITFTCGQAFRWRKLDNQVWRGVVRGKVLDLYVECGQLFWRTLPDEDEMLVRDYLRLDDDVESIYRHLSAADEYMAGLIRRFYGLRLLRQEPTETLLSFVCSAVNSIPRISAAIEALSLRYGDLVCEQAGSCYYSFPSVEKLAAMPADALSDAGSLGFRGRNLQLVARQLLERGENWLDSLRSRPYIEARQELMSLRGVGRKIADCVCLFALDKDEAVPVDTHVKQLANRLWGLDFEGRALTDRLYARIMAVFAERYGSLAGWAQQFLYYEDLLRSRNRFAS
ncbi:MAG: DNA glycosylase [Armatimonadota bacterium]|nr:DNA glycosylase [Armatimonadota bacterium]